MVNKLVIAPRYASPRTVVTAHRGFSGKYPENTLIAFTEAARLPVDIIEFDVRGTKDGVPVVLHDGTIDRTSNGTGAVGDHTLEDLKRLNFSHWQGDHARGAHTASPQFPDCSIPTLEETFDAIPRRITLNVQVYQTNGDLLGTICALFKRYDLYTRGYLTVNRFTDAEAVQRIDADIEVCILERQHAMDEDILHSLKARNAMVIQPLRSYCDRAFCTLVNDMGFMANMFYSNTDEDNREFIVRGMRGIHSDYPDVLCATIESIGVGR
ncbi:MAG: glycerophosphodiester phosphodiesterase family protein [Spirochaetota bacterium]